MAGEENSERNEEFERRLLALARDQFAELEVEFPNGFEFGDFVLSFHVYTRPGPDDQMQPWYGGQLPGWGRITRTPSSTTSYSIDRELLESSLRIVRDEQDWLKESWFDARREARDAEDDEDYDEDEDEGDEDED